jgi:4-hydroxy-2-oxoglutarate aldolase
VPVALTCATWMTRISLQGKMGKVRSILRAGVYAPVLTPFTEENGQDLDLQAFRAGILRLAKTGVGLVLSGTLGEGNLLSRSEKRTLVKATREVLRENELEHAVPLVAGVGAGSLRETIDNCADAAAEGADAVCV